MIILASEDIGLADSRALGIAIDAFRALEVIGLPEAAYALTHAATYLALAPKSNSMKDAIGRSRAAVDATPAARVPPHLRSAVHEGQRAMGDGVGYDYPHDRAGAIVSQQYLPDDALHAVLYRPKTAGEELALSERLAQIDAVLGKPDRS